MTLIELSRKTGIVIPRIMRHARLYLGLSPGKPMEISEDEAWKIYVVDFLYKVFRLTDAEVAFVLKNSWISPISFAESLSIIFNDGRGVVDIDVDEHRLREDFFEKIR